MADAYNVVDLLCLGEAMVEFDEFSPGKWQQGVGGDTFNVAVAARRAGVKAGFASALGQDDWGDSILSFAKLEGVDISRVRRDATRPTAIYFVRHDQTGHHFSYRRAGSAASACRFEQCLPELLRASRVFHFSGISLAVHPDPNALLDALIPAAKTIGVLLSFDPNYRPRLWSRDVAKETTLRAMRSADILLPGVDDLGQLFNLGTPKEALAFCQDLGARTVALKDGPRDVLLWDWAGHCRVSPPRIQARDASGAGDCFDGTFIAHWLRGKSAAESATLAAQAAARSTLQSGALGSLQVIDSQ